MKSAHDRQGSRSCRVWWRARVGSGQAGCACAWQHSDVRSCR